MVRTNNFTNRICPSSLILPQKFHQLDLNIDFKQVACRALQMPALQMQVLQMLQALQR